LITPGDREGVPPIPPAPPDSAGATLRPRWLWIAFALVALAIPVIGLALERSR